jgi:predicted metallopeptidase
MMALEQSQDWTEIADAIISKYPVAMGHIEIDKVLFLAETEKTPKKYADTRKVAYPFDFLTEYKYIIIFYENNTQAMSDAQRHMLCFHELLHIDADFEKIRKHDIEDFRELISRYGINWDIDPNLVDILDDDVEGDV